MEKKTKFISLNDIRQEIRKINEEQTEKSFENGQIENEKNFEKSQVENEIEKIKNEKIFEIDDFLEFKESITEELEYFIFENFNKNISEEEIKLLKE